MRTQHHFLSALAATAFLFAACGDDGGATDASSIDAAAAGGTFSLAWSLSDGSNAITCSDVGALSVSVSIIEQGAAGGSVDAFSCTGGQATSRKFSPGTYDLTIDLRASGSRSLISERVLLANIQIVDGGDATLPAQTFVVSPVGGFTFLVNGQATAGNCETVANSGAGIVGLAFALEDATSTCVAATFDVAAGAVGAAASYTSDCTTPPAPLGCIEADQLVTVNPIRSGPLELTISGQKDGPINCYDRVSTFSVAGAMLVTELGALPLTLENSLACDPNFIPPDAGPPDAGVADATSP